MAIMRFRVLTGLFFILIFCTGFVSAFSNSGGGTWEYDGIIKITETSGTNLDNYPVLVTLNSGNFNFVRAKNDGSDIRFSDINDNELNYWIEDWNSGFDQAKIWVRVPHMPASGVTSVKIWYGNPSATSSSNGEAVFEFFDDFQGTSLDLNKWNVYTQGTNARVEVSNGICNIISPSSKSSAGINSKAFFGINTIFVVKRAKYTTGWDLRGPMQRQGYLDANLGSSSVQNEIDHGTEFRSESWVRWVTMNNGNYNYPYRDWADVGFSEGTFYISGVGWNNTDGFRGISWFKNNQRIASMDYISNEYIPSSPMHVWLYSAPYSGGESNFGYMAVDYAFVKPYAISEPIVSVTTDTSRGAIAFTMEGDHNYYLGDKIRLSGTNTDSLTTYLVLHSAWNTNTRLTDNYVYLIGRAHV